MKMKQKIQIISFVVVLGVIAVVNMKVMLDVKHPNCLTLASIEAFSYDDDKEGKPNKEDGKLDCNYVRKETTCKIRGNGSIQVVGVGIIKVKGELEIDGKVVCSGGGNDSCTPIECKDLYFWCNK